MNTLELVQRLLVLAATSLLLPSSGDNARRSASAAIMRTEMSPSNFCRDGLDSSSSSISEEREDFVEDQGRYKLYLVLMAPFPASVEVPDPRSWEAGHRVAPAVQLALDQINNRSDILRDYELVLLKSDTACTGRTGYAVTKAIVDIVRTSDKPIVGIVGPGCTAAAIALAEQISRPQYSLIAITPSATSPNLEKEEYVNTFATISSSTAYVKVYRELMDHNSWDAISILYDEKREYFLDTFRRFSDEERNNSRVVYQLPVLDGDNEKLFPLSDIKRMDKGGRVILSFAATSTAQKLMCLAYHEGMIYPTYQWVFHDRTLSQLNQSVSFIYNGVEYHCDEEDMDKAIHGIILVQYEIERGNDDLISLTGQNFSEYNEMYTQALMRCTNDSYLNYANTNYDAAWAFALALNKTAARVNLTTYRYGQPNITDDIRENLFKISFDGASGPIQFRNHTHSPITDIKVLQLKLINETDSYVREVKVAVFNGTLNILPNASAAFINDTFDNIHVYVHKALGILVILVASILLGFTGILHTANTVWYKYKSIKATSPNISHLIFGGCYLFGISIIIYSVEQTFSWSEIVHSVMCNSFRWCLILGYTLIFGTVLAKVWRVYRLFKHFRNKSPGCLVSDNALVIFVILLLLADVFLCSIWDSVDPFVHKDYVESRIQINKIPTLIIRSTCTCRHFSLWIGMVGAYKGIIALLLVVFSILNRKIRRRDFQHTKKINILIYSLTMMGGVFFPIYFLFRSSDIHISYVILCMILSIVILMSCLTLFLTPIGQVIKIKMKLSEDAKFTQEIKRRISNVSLLSILSAATDENS